MTSEQQFCTDGELPSGGVCVLAQAGEEADIDLDSRPHKGRCACPTVGGWHRVNGAGYTKPACSGGGWGAVRGTHSWMEKDFVLKEPTVGS